MLRDKLVEIALQWQSKYGVAPQITSVISEFDAAMLVGMSESDYSDYMQDKTAVSKGADFVFNHQRYQVKANRPSGKPGSKVTMVPKATNYLWDKLIWILYDQHYVMLEAWEWDVEDYKLEFDDKKKNFSQRLQKREMPIHKDRRQSLKPLQEIYAFTQGDAADKNASHRISILILYCHIHLYFNKFLPPVSSRIFIC